jgi:hypothetical protein
MCSGNGFAQIKVAAPLRCRLAASAKACLSWERVEKRFPQFSFLHFFFYQYFAWLDKSGDAELISRVGLWSERSDEGQPPPQQANEWCGAGFDSTIPLCARQEEKKAALVPLCSHVYS